MDAGKVSLVVALVALIIGSVGVAISYTNVSGVESKLSSEVARLDKSLKDLSVNLDAVSKSTQAAQQASSEQVKQLQEQLKAKEQLESKLRAATAEGAVVAYGSIDANDFKPVGDAFMKQYPGIKVEYVRASPSELFTRVTTELTATGKTADVIVASLPGMLQMQRENIFKNYVSPEVAAFPKETHDSKGQMSPVIMLAQTIVYNTKKLQQSQLPKTLEELADAKWKGQVISHDPKIGTTATQIFASLMTPLGKDRITNFLTAFKRNVDPTFTGSTSDVIDNIARGEYAIGIVAQLHDYARLKQAGAPLGLLTLEGVPLMVAPTTAAITKTATHPNAAELLISYLTSEQAQTIFGNIDVRFPARQGVKAKWTIEGVAPGMQLFVYPTPDADANIKTYTNQFKSIFS